jgi:uncharacterized membrane protein
LPAYWIDSLHSVLTQISLFQDDSLGLIASVIAMIFFGFADSLWKVPTFSMGPARTIFYRNLFVLLVVIPYFIVSEKKTYISTNAIWVTLLIAIAGYAGLYFFARAIKTGYTSIVVPVTGANTLITVLISIWTLEASLNWISLFGILITILGISMLKFNLKNGRISLILLKDNGLRFAFLSALLWGISFAYTYYAVTFTGPALFTLILESVILIVSGVHGYFEDGSIIPKFSSVKRIWPVLALIGILGATGSIFNTIALDRASINTVTAIVALAPAISVVFGQTYYGERLTLQQKIAVFLIITGVFVISYFRYHITSL